MGNVGPSRRWTVSSGERGSMESVWGAESFSSEESGSGQERGSGRGSGWSEGGWTNNNNGRGSGFSQQTNRQIEEVWGRGSARSPGRGANQ